MAYTIADLPNNGQTQFYHVQYDDTLSPARGKDLATKLMHHCDDDFALLRTWFSGRGLDTSPPINVSINQVAMDAAGNPSPPNQYIGGKWGGWGPVPLQVTINFGDLAMGEGTPIQLARYLLVAEVSEMFMRSFSFYTFGPWFRFGEGNKGESLSRFLSTQLLKRAYPGITALPTLRIATWNVSSSWLNTDRANWLEANDEDIDPSSPEIGCGTLFLFYLHDQLGHRIEDIINAGGGHLSNVYENLPPHDASTNAWPKFSQIIDDHYPRSATSDYEPPLDTMFPVSDLAFFTAPVETSWVRAASPPAVSVDVDHAALFPLTIDITSSDSSLIKPLTLTVAAGARTSLALLAVLPQTATFSPTSVTLTATYAGRSLSRDVMVVRPESTARPPLSIGIDRSADPCATPLVEGRTQTFLVSNLASVLNDPGGYSFSWSVSGATPGPTDSPELTIYQLPQAGTTVTVEVTVTNGEGLQAAGSFSFHTVPGRTTLKELDGELRCRLSRFRNGTLSIPPWVPIEQPALARERLAALEKEVSAAIEAAAQLKALVQTMQQATSPG